MQRSIQLLLHQCGQGNTLSVFVVDPFPSVYAIPCMVFGADLAVVEAFRAADGGAEPDLLGCGLLVDDPGAPGWVGEVDDAVLGARC